MLDPQTTMTNWEKEFDEKFPGMHFNHPMEAVLTHGTPTEIKSFIHQVADAAREEGEFQAYQRTKEADSFIKQITGVGNIVEMRDQIRQEAYEKGKEEGRREAKRKVLKDITEEDMERL